jgi:hypothetical protein
MKPLREWTVNELRGQKHLEGQWNSVTVFSLQNSKIKVAIWLSEFWYRM